MLAIQIPRIDTHVESLVLNTVVCSGVRVTRSLVLHIVMHVFYVLLYCNIL
jgi:uncharacterized membrane protein YGL010W